MADETRRHRGTNDENPPIGADPYHIEALRVVVGNPHVFSTVEVALLDLIGKATNRSATDLLGGAARHRVPFLPTCSSGRPAMTTGVEP